MNLVLWAAQGFLAVVFLAAGIMKLTQAKTVLETRPGFGYVTERTALEMKLIGFAEVLGSLGLVLPWWRQTLPMLTPMAAAGLTVLMIGATATHLRRRESMVFTAGLALVALFVALGRGGQLN